jgi:hypothetical protein
VSGGCFAKVILDVRGWQGKYNPFKMDKTEDYQPINTHMILRTELRLAGPTLNLETRTKADYSWIAGIGEKPALSQNRER